MANSKPEVDWDGIIASIDGTDQAERQEEPKGPAFYTVAIYQVELADGGPEEGGRHAGHQSQAGGSNDDHPVASSAECVSPAWQPSSPGTAEDHAFTYAKSLQTLLDVTINVGRYEIESVCSTPALLRRSA
jgi:hypothetical protein